MHSLNNFFNIHLYFSLHIKWEVAFVWREGK